jgi:hypothetical protein
MKNRYIQFFLITTLTFILNSGITGHAYSQTFGVTTIGSTSYPQTNIGNTNNGNPGSTSAN